MHERQNIILCVVTEELKNAESITTHVQKCLGFIHIIRYFPKSTAKYRPNITFRIMTCKLQAKAQMLIKYHQTRSMMSTKCWDRRILQKSPAHLSDNIRWEWSHFWRWEILVTEAVMQYPKQVRKISNRSTRTFGVIVLWLLVRLQQITDSSYKVTSHFAKVYLLVSVHALMSFSVFKHSMQEKNKNGRTGLMLFYPAGSLVRIIIKLVFSHECMICISGVLRKQKWKAFRVLNVRMTTIWWFWTVQVFWNGGS